MAIHITNRSKGGRKPRLSRPRAEVIRRAVNVAAGAAAANLLRGLAVRALTGLPDRPRLGDGWNDEVLRRAADLVDFCILAGTLDPVTELKVVLGWEKRWDVHLAEAEALVAGILGESPAESSPKTRAAA